MAKGGSLLYAVVGIVIMACAVGAIVTQSKTDTTGRATIASCGDGRIDHIYGEECDLPDMNAKTCVSFGYIGGELRCSACKFDMNRCVPKTPVAPMRRCGNNLVEGTEQCDDGNIMNGDGCSSMCRLETRPSV